MQTVAQICACFQSFQKGMFAFWCSQTLNKTYKQHLGQIPRACSLSRQ